MFQGISCFPGGLEKNIPCGVVLGALARFLCFFLQKLAMATFRTNTQVNNSLLCFANSGRHFSVCITTEFKHISHFYSFHNAYEIIAT